MRNVHKKRAQDKRNYLQNKTKGKHPVTITQKSQGHLAGHTLLLIIGRTLIKKGHLSRHPPMPVIGRTPRRKGRPPIPVREDPETKRASSWASSHIYYWEDPETKRASSHTRYWEDPDKVRALPRCPPVQDTRETLIRKGQQFALTVTVPLEVARAKLRWCR